MSLSLSLSAGSRTLVIELDREDIESAENLRRTCPSNVAALFGPVHSSDHTLVLSSQDLVQNVSALIENSNKHLPKVQMYQFRIGTMGDIGISDSFGTGRVSGIFLPNDPLHSYSLKCGVDLCKLEKIRLLDDGTGEIVGEEDMRNMPAIVTKNLGTITIRKRNAISSTIASLKRILKFAKLLNENERVTIEMH